MKLNWTICKNTWRFALSSKLRAVILTVVFLQPILGGTIGLCAENEFPREMFSGPHLAILMVLICGSGTIGSQLNDGTLSLVLSRPLTISQYVLSKWFAISFGAFVISSGQLFSELLVALSRTPAAVDLTTLAANFIERALLCFGFSAVLVLLSSLVSGVKDLGIYLLAQLALQILSLTAYIKPAQVPEGIFRHLVQVVVPVATGTAEILGFALTPFFQVAPILSGLPMAWSTIPSYTAVVTVFLSIAIFSLNRRELPYGAD